MGIYWVFAEKVILRRLFNSLVFSCYLLYRTLMALTQAKWRVSFPGRTAFFSWVASCSHRFRDVYGAPFAQVTYCLGYWRIFHNHWASPEQIPLSILWTFMLGCDWCHYRCWRSPFFHGSILLLFYYGCSKEWRVRFKHHKPLQWVETNQLKILNPSATKSI